jgi:hypothetical protein
MALSPRPGALRITQLDADGKPLGQPVIIEREPDAERFDFQLIDADAYPYPERVHLIRRELHADPEPVRLAGSDEHGSTDGDDSGGA